MNTVPDDYGSAMQRAASRRMDIPDLLRCAAALHEANISVTELYKTWIAHNADHPALHAIMFNYAVELTDTGDLSGAAIALRETIRIAPAFAPPYINLGGILERLGLRDQAVAIWSELADAPASLTGETINYKILSLKQIGRVLEGANLDAAAEQALARCVDLNPDQPDVIQHLLALRQRQCVWPVIEGTDRVPARRLVGGISPLSVACIADDPMFHLGTAWHYCRHSIGIPPMPKPVTRAARSGKPRIGYVSSDLRDHAVGFAMTDVMETHDHDAFEILVYDCGIATADGTRARIKRAAFRWTDLNGLDDQQAHERIQQDGIDILVDLNGYTKDARTKLFAMRPAPIAVNWFGFPGTMGSPYHQYLIADEQVIPHDHEIYYAERILRLPCYQPNDRWRVVHEAPSRQQVGLPDEAFVYCCLNGMQKITALVFQRWMIILRHVPGSVLWLLSGTADANERLRQKAAELGVSPGRLVFADKRANPDHLARYRLADLFLDTFPYGAHTTGSDSLWMGVPVLTLRGRSFASRVCASLVHAAGIPELICETPNDYVVRAIALGSDRSQLEPFRQRLVAGRDTCALFDTPRLVRALEARYREMLADLGRDNLPRPDLANLDIYREVALDSDLASIELLDDVAYTGQYQQKLAALDAVFPIPPDQRLWPAVKAHEYFRSTRG